MRRLLVALAFVAACGGSVTVYHQRQSDNPAMCTRWSVDSKGYEVEAPHTVPCPEGVPPARP